eukprot:CAMPEP_0174363494 /NCGR_PEP_ID=MMETSP0811_2-20130205/69055_1 /TAXON_ID=73025 ORGANISM="Eutreptiella gymnastica-like, Strain CCMP1594" /NCGR_SAMPLE_ID=MMETSP0811_2 /ASSEMBLY_ACC=CAM_ASM_000667 /LENGTH=118 /DNA_ID=CAMNT_0015502237 /DNA_START=719 /DNA_END=1072 /DNA_ORIENTATION=+
MAKSGKEMTFLSSSFQQGRDMTILVVITITKWWKAADRKPEDTVNESEIYGPQNIEESLLANGCHSGEHAFRGPLALIMILTIVIAAGKSQRRSAAGSESELRIQDKPGIPTQNFFLW